MVLRRRTLSRTLPALLVCGVLLLWAPRLWCEQQTVKPGDRASVHFTCRLKGGEVAASSYPSVAGDPGLRRSAIFVARAADEPIPIVAGKPQPASDSGQERGLEGEIVYQLAGLIVGLPVGERQTREIASGRMQEKKKGDYLLQVARVRQRTKEMRLKPGDYQARTGNAAQVGQSFTLDPAVPGRVSSVTESEVVVRFFAKAGDKVPTPFGEGTVKELPDRYEIVIDARQGTLVRSGGFVGRIASVDDRFITIDYSNPFGGETLLCDVLVESVRPGGTQE